MHISGRAPPECRELNNLARRVVAGVLSRVERRAEDEIGGRQTVTDPLGGRSG